MGVTERRAREKEELRHKILEAASQLFVNEGFENVSIRRIAERIEYSPATIYLYFKDKADLIGAICESSFSEMQEAILASARASDPLIALRLGLRAYIDFGLSHPHHYLIVFGMMPPADRHKGHHEENPQALQLGLQTFGVLRTNLAACVQAGLIPDGDIETMSQTAWMTIHGVTSLLITSYGEAGSSCFPFLDKEHLIDSALDLLITGLRNCSLPGPRQK